MRLIIFLFLFFPFGLTSCDFHPEGGKAVSRAPDFTLPVLSDADKKITLSEINRENPVLLVFWAAWCPACVEEIPTLNQWHEKLGQLRILGVNVQESRQDISSFTKEMPIRYPVLLDEEGDVAGRYGLTGLPVSILLAKGGKVIYYGFSLPGNIDQLIEQRRPAKI